jgi:GAF domain-containing protein
MTLRRTYGWLCLADKIGADEFDAEDEELSSHMGMLVGRAYENLNLQLALKLQAEQLQRSEQQSQRLVNVWATNVNRVYALLGGANIVIARARNRDQLCKEACRLAILQGKFRLAYIEILDAVSGAMSLVAAAGDAEDAVDLARRMSTAPEGRGDLLSQALSFLRPSTCNELQSADPPVRLRSEMLKRGYRAIAALPMSAGNALLGRFVLLSEKPQFFDDAEMRLQTALAGHISLAIWRRGKTSRAVKDLS